VAWRADGERLASGSRDRTVRLWSADGGATPVVLEGHAGSVTSVAWSPDGRRLASASEDGAVRVWIVDASRPPPAAPIRPRDPRLWTATGYCVPVANRQQILGLSEELSQAQYELCLRRVEAASGGR
jgi:WD40 repeat protein